ncbi:lipoprotein [Alteromonas sp. KUL49]|uniref:LPS translocon maturation chaperone LptM n=1 Tax=Alteromonas sp. KUL49 TaxID=2480798 RepID=UPI00102F2A38|nr:lipoprotein [Alteromonas sp. KUL49]TAP39307.1 hypothetical protein EYS00_12275 [Alteromonas sp. KUL49]GEA12097.1 hypothetical protein KUL49_24720 [Alteromonas sp. KUL49]
MITAFYEVIAGIAVLKKCVACLFFTLFLGGCGYKGALYIPPESELSEPDVQATKQEDAQQSLAPMPRDS